MCYCVIAFCSSFSHKFFASSFVLFARFSFWYTDTHTLFLSHTCLPYPFIIWFCSIGCQFFCWFCCKIVHSSILFHWCGFFWLNICFNNLKSNFVVALPCLEIIKNILRVFSLVRFSLLWFHHQFYHLCVCKRWYVVSAFILCSVNSLFIFHALIFVINICRWIGVECASA